MKGSYIVPTTTKFFFLWFLFLQRDKMCSAICRKSFTAKTPTQSLVGLNLRPKVALSQP